MYNTVCADHRLILNSRLHKPIKWKRAKTVFHKGVFYFILRLASLSRKVRINYDIYERQPQSPKEKRNRKTTYYKDLVFAKFVSEKKEATHSCVRCFFFAVRCFSKKSGNHTWRNLWKAVGQEIREEYNPHLLLRGHSERTCHGFSSHFTESSICTPAGRKWRTIGIVFYQIPNSVDLYARM